MVIVDIAMNQIRREGFAPVALSPLQSHVLALYVREMPRPVHDDRIFVHRWTNSADPQTNLKVFVNQVNKRLKAANLMLRRSMCFGYYLVKSPEPAKMLVQATAEAIREVAHV